MSNEKTELKTASVLAFEAKLANSDALMMAGNWEDRDWSDKDKDSDGKSIPNPWKPIEIVEKSVRGTISNRFSKDSEEYKDPAKLDKKVTNANPQTVDNAALPFDCDTLKVSFTLRIIGNLETPFSCDDPDYQTALSKVVNNYSKKKEFKELAKRYATNIVNGRFLWRNRVCAEEIEVHVKTGGEAMAFDAYKIDYKGFREPENKEDKQNLDKLSEVIKKGLKESSFTFIEVDAFVKLGRGQMVYPSQEMVMGGGSGDKSKYLYKLNDVAAMHSQKIGNALRTIDDWHTEGNEAGVIAVEPYGSVTNRGKAYRHPKNKNDFYTLLDNWVLRDKEPATEEQQHYVMAVLIRGGVFGEAKEKNKKSKEE